MPNSGSVYQRESDGRWLASLTVNGKRKTVYAKSEREAKTKLASLQGQAAITGTLPNPGKRTVSDLLDFWLETVKPSLKPRTHADYGLVGERYVKPYIGGVRLSKLEPAHLQNLYAQLESLGLKRAPTHAHALLHRALGLAFLWGWLPYNVADRVVNPTYRPGRQEMWSEEDLTVFLDGAREHPLYPVWLTVIATGCRLGEALALRWEDVDLVKGAVTIRRNVQWINRGFVEGSPKTRAGERTVTVPQEAVTALRRQRAQQAEWRLKAGPNWQDQGRVFANQQGRTLYQFHISHALKTVCQRLGVPELTPHGLRHLHASLLLAQGLPLPAVSQRLGHAHTGVTASIYAHALRQQDGEAAEAIGRVLAGAKTANMI